tara:strand:- start:658 stop:1773 length:1116 start_codon:yes stop_codon:yes gene_type:complete
MSKKINPLRRIVSALSGNWDNTVTSIQSILELIEKEVGLDRLPSEVLLFCDRKEKRKIVEKIPLVELEQMLERMGLGVEIVEVPTINEIYDEGFPYIPQNGDIINTRPGSSLYPALMINSVVEFSVEDEIEFYLAEVSPTGTSMTWSNVSFYSKSGFPTIKSKEFKLLPQDNLIRIMKNSGAESWDGAPGRLEYNKTRVDEFKSIEMNPTSNPTTIEYYLQEALGKGISFYDRGPAFEKLTGYELAHNCDNIGHVVINVEFPREAKNEKGEGVDRREDDAVALSTRGNLICFSCKFIGAGDVTGPSQIAKVARAIDAEIYKMEAFPFPGANPRQRVYNVIVTTTRALGYATNAKSVIVTNLEGLAKAIKHL